MKGRAHSVAAVPKPSCDACQVVADEDDGSTAAPASRP